MKSALIFVHQLVVLVFITLTFSSAYAEVVPGGGNKPGPDDSNADKKAPPCLQLGNYSLDSNSRPGDCWYTTNLWEDTKDGKVHTAGALHMIYSDEGVINNQGNNNKRYITVYDTIEKTTTNLSQVDARKGDPLFPEKQAYSFKKETNTMSRNLAKGEKVSMTTDYGEQRSPQLPLPLVKGRAWHKAFYKGTVNRTIEVGNSKDGFTKTNEYTTDHKLKSFELLRKGHTLPDLTVPLEDNSFASANSTSEKRLGGVYNASCEMDFTVPEFNQGNPFVANLANWELLMSCDASPNNPAGVQEWLMWADRNNLRNGNVKSGDIKDYINNYSRLIGFLLRKPQNTPGLDFDKLFNFVLGLI